MWARVSGNPHHFNVYSVEMSRHIGVFVLVGRVAESQLVGRTWGMPR